MKLHLPASLRKALLFSLGAFVAFSTSAQAATLHSAASLQTYTDFGQNMGRYVTGARVNALLSAIRANEGITITYTDGRAPYRLVTDQMISFDGQTNEGAFTAIGYNFLASVQHNGTPNPTFTSQELPANNSVRYTGIEYRSSSIFITSPDTDYKITRLSKVVTDAQTSSVYTGEVPRDTLIYRAGAGVMSVRNTDGSVNVIYDAYSYITGGIARTDGMSVVGQSGDSRGLSTSFNFTDAGISGLNPLPFSGDSGDSGSPMWVWNAETGAYEYLVAAQAVNGTYGRGTNTYCKGAPEWSVETMDSYSREVAMNDATGTVHIGAVTTQGQTLTDTAGRVGEQWSGEVTNAAGETLTTFQGVHSGINTWMSLNPEINKDNWYAYGDAYLNAGDAVSDSKQLSKATLFCTQNLVFNSSAAQNLIEIDGAGVDLGVGYARFSRADGAGDTVQYSISGGMFNHAGYVVDAGVAVHLTQANTDANYVREWRKVGEGDLYIEGTGNNEVVLNVGGSGSVYLNESGTNAYAAYNVLANTGATVVLQGGVNQIARDFTFGNGGGKLDLYGHNMAWDNSKTDVSAEGFTIHALTEEAVITNSSATAVTLTVEKPETVFLGSFQDQKNAGGLNIVYNGTGKWTLNTIATNLRNSGKSSFTVAQGAVELAGTNTKHAMGSIDGRSTRRLVNTEDWHYADAAMKVVVENGAEFTLGSHARLTGDVFLKAGGAFTINEGVRHAYEYVEGGQALEDVTTDFYRGFYGLHGNIVAEEGTTIRFLYSEGTNAEQVYTGRILGNANVEMELGHSGATLRLSGMNEFDGSKSLTGGGLISDNGLNGLGRVTGQENAWHVAEDAYIAAKGADAVDLIGKLHQDSTGVMALAQDQKAVLDLQEKGYTSLFIGALAGEDVHYGTAGTTLRTVNNGGKDRWLLGGGGGNLIVDASLQNASGELLLGNEYTTGKVTLTNKANRIGTITFAGQVTLEYTEEAALGGATVNLDYTNRLLLLSLSGVNQVRESSTGVILVDKLGGAAMDMRRHPGLYIGSTGSVELEDAPILAEGESFRFGGITGTLKVNAAMTDQNGGPTGLSVDAQTFSGGVLELARAATITGAVDVRGYDAARMTPTMPRQGDITLQLDAGDALASASSVTLGEGGIIDINGTAQTFRDLSMAQGSLLTDGTAERGGSLTVEVTDGQTSNLAGDLNVGSLTKAGLGEMVLSGTNNCGTFTINQGTATLTSNNALSADGITLINAGGTLNTAGAALNQSIIINGGTMVTGGNAVSGSIAVAENGNGTISQQGNATTINSTIDVGNGGSLVLTGSQFTLTNAAINTEERSGTISVLANQLNINNSEVADIGGTLSFDAEGNQTLSSNRSGDNTTRNIAHLNIGGGPDKELHLDEVTWNTIWNIGKLTGEGKLVWDADTTHWFATRVVLNGDNDFSGSVIANRKNTGSTVRPYATHLELANDGAAKAAHLVLSGADNNDYMGLAINTDNASMLSLTGNEYTVLYAAPSMTGIGKQQGEGNDTPGGLDVKPVSTRNATLSITGDAVATFSGDVQGGENGLGLSIVKSGSGTQTFDGSSVTFNDVSVRSGTLNLSTTNLNVNGNIDIVRGAALSMSKPYVLGADKVIAVSGNADASAQLSTTLDLAGGILHFSGESLNTTTAALSLTSVSGGSVNVSFSDTSALETDKKYWLANQNWTGVTVNSSGVEYLSVDFDTNDSGLYATFSVADDSRVWEGNDTQHQWTTSVFGPDSVAFSDSMKAAFTDKASNKNVVIDGSLNAASLIFDSTGDYTFTGTGSVHATSLIHKGTGSTDLGGKVTIAGAATVSAGTLTMNTGDSVQGVVLGDNATLRLTANGIATGEITGGGTVSLAAGANVTADLPTIGEAGIGSLILESGRYKTSSTLNVKDSLRLMGDAHYTTYNGRVLQDGGVVYLAGNLVLDTSTGNTTLSNAVTGAGDATGTITKQSTGTLTVAADITAKSFWIMGGTVSVNKDAALNVDSVAIRMGSGIQVHRSADTQQHLGTVQMERSSILTLVSDEQPTTAMLVDKLDLYGVDATVKQQGNAGAMVISALKGSATSSDLELINESTSTKVALFELGGADDTADFTGKITLTSTPGKNQGTAVVVLNDDKVAANAVVDLSAANSTSALLGLGVNAQQVRVAGLASGEGLGRRASVFSGAPEINADTPSSFDGDGITRELLITTASGAESSFYGRVGTGLNLVVDGQGTQRFLGDMSDFNATLTLRGGTLELGQTGIGSASSIGFNADLAGGTLVLSGGSINLGAGTLTLSGETAINMAEDGEYIYQDGNDLENGFHTMAVIKSGNVVESGGSIMGQGVLSGRELVILSNGVYALDPATRMTYYVNTEAAYAASGAGSAYDKATSLVLNAEAAVLNMQSSLGETTTGGIVAGVAGGRVNLGEGVVLGNADLHDNRAVSLGGSGTYRVEVLATGADTTLGKQGNVSLSDDWSGMVELQGDGGSQSRLLLEDYGNSHSTIKLTGNAGRLTDGAEVSAKLQLEDSATQSALTIVEGGTATFNGAIGGSGSIKMDGDGSGIYKFHGNLNQWTGSFIGASGSSSLYFLSGVSDVGAGIVRVSGQVSVHVGESGGTGTNVTFRKEVQADTLTIESNSSATFTGTSTVAGAVSSSGTLAVANGGNLTLQGSSTVSGNIAVSSGGSLAINGTLAGGASVVLEDGSLDLTGLTAAAQFSSLNAGGNSTIALDAERMLGTTGALSLTGSTMLDLTGLTLTEGTGAYVLATGQSVTLGNGVDFTLDEKYDKSLASLSVLDGTSLVLIMATDVQSLVWKGGAGQWTTASAQTPWYKYGTQTAAAFKNGDKVTFTASTEGNVATLGESVSSFSLTMENAAAATVNLNGYSLSINSTELGSGSTLTVSGNSGSMTNTGRLDLQAGAKLVLDNSGADIAMGEVFLGDDAVLDVRAAGSVKAQSVAVTDAADATIKLGQDMAVAAEGSQAATDGALCTAASGHTLSILSEGTAHALTVDKFDIAGNATRVSLQNATLTVKGAATVGTRAAGGSVDSGIVTVGTGASLNLDGGVNWNKADADSTDVVDVTIGQGGSLNVNAGSANTLNNVTVQAGGSLHFAANTRTTLCGSLSLAESIDNEGVVDFAERELTIALDSSFNVAAAGYTDINDVEGDNGFHHTLSGTAIANTGSGSIANAGNVQVSFDGVNYALYEDGTFGKVYDRSAYHVRNGSVSYDELANVQGIQSIILDNSSHADATLNLNAALADTVTGGIQSQGGTVNIGGGITLEKERLITAEGKTTTLSGSGVYRLADAADMPTGVSLSTDSWNGTVQFTGTASSDLDLSHAWVGSGDSASTVEFHEWSGSVAGNQTIGAKVVVSNEPEGSGMLIANESEASINFANGVSGDAASTMMHIGPGTLNLIFSDADVDWAGDLFNVGGVLNVTYSGMDNAANSIVNGGVANVNLGSLKEYSGGISSADTTVSGQTELSGSNFMNTLTVAEKGAAVISGQSSVVRSTVVDGSLSVTEDGELTLMGGLKLKQAVSNSGLVVFNGFTAQTITLDSDSFSLKDYYLDGAGERSADGNGVLVDSGAVVFDLAGGGTLEGTDKATVSLGGQTYALNQNGTISTTAHADLASYHVRTGTESYSVFKDMAGVTTIKLENDASLKLDEAPAASITAIESSGGTIETDRDVAFGAAALKLSGSTALTGSGGTLQLTTVQGSGSLTVNGPTVIITGNNSSYTGDIVVSSGTLKAGNNNALGSMNAEAHTISVLTNGTLDVNGLEGSGDGYTVVLAGGTLTNSGSDMGYGKRQLVTHVSLTADSKIDAVNEFGITGGDYAATSVALESYILEKTGTDTFHMQNATVTGTGKIKVSEGTLAMSTGPNAGVGSYSANFEMAGGTVSGKVALGGNIEVQTTADSSFSATMNLGAHTVTFTGDKDLNVTGNISGNGNLINNGTGVRTLRGTNSITGLNNTGSLILAGNTTATGGIANTGTISVVGSGASSMTTFNVNSGDETMNLGNIALNNAELHFGSSAESRVRNISTLTVDGAAKLTQNSWNNLMHIAALNDGAGEGDRTFTWQMNTNHYTNSVLYLDGEGDFSGTFVASRGDAGGDGAYQGHLQVNHQKALQNAVLEVNGVDASNNMSVALNAGTVETRGVKGNANAIVYAGEANTAINQGAGRTAPTSSQDAVLAMNVAAGELYEYAGKVESRISLQKGGEGTQVFSGNMGSFNGSVDVEGGILNILNAASVEVKDVTIGANATLGVYKGTEAPDSPASEHEGTLTIKNAHSLIAKGAGATLNANVVMESGSTLDLGATGGEGLTLGSSLTLQENVYLSDADLEAVAGLDYGERYILFNGVDSLTLDQTYTGAITPEMQIDAADWFHGVEAKNYYVVYDGSNVGQVAIFCVTPEPATSTLSLLGLGLLACRRKRK